MLKLNLLLLSVLLSFVLNLYSVQGIAATEPRITFSVKALFKDRAMIEINGENRLLTAGEQSPEGVKLISSDARQALIVCHGAEHTLYINQTVYSGASQENKKKEFDIPLKLVPGKSVPFRKEVEESFTKYILKHEFKSPETIQYGQEAIWIGAGKKLLRFDTNKESWGVFDSSFGITDDIRKLSVSDDLIVLNASKMKNNSRQYGLFAFDYKARRLYRQLDITPDSFQLDGDQLWFVNYSKGLGVLLPKNKTLDIKYSDVLLDNTRAREGAKNVSVRGDDIWYSRSTGVSSEKIEQRLNQVCVTHYNVKTNKYTGYTRKDMKIDASKNCSHIVASDNQVWVSHGGYYDGGVSVLDVKSRKWAHLKASKNNISINAQKIMLKGDRLLMITKNQLISLNTKTLRADIILGDAVIKQPWQSEFYVSEDYIWLTTIEKPNKKLQRSSLVLYQIPVEKLTKDAL